MKKLLALGMALVLMMSLFASAEIIGNIYVNTDLHVTVTAPEGWTLEKGSKNLPEATLGDSVDLVTVRIDDGDNLIVGAIYVGAFSSFLTPDLMLTSIEESAVSEYASYGITPVVERSTVTFMGEECESLMFTGKLFGTDFCQRFIYVIDGDYMLSVVSTSFTPEQVDYMLTFVNKI